MKLIISIIISGLLLWNNDSQAFRMHGHSNSPVSCMQKNSPSDPEEVFPFLYYNAQMFQHWNQQNIVFNYVQDPSSPYQITQVTSAINFGMNMWNNIEVNKYHLTLSNNIITTSQNPVGINDGINSIYIDPNGTIPSGNQMAYSPAQTIRTTDLLTGEILDADIRLRFFDDSIPEPGQTNFPINFELVFAHDLGHAIGIHDTNLAGSQDIMQFPLNVSYQSSINDEQAIRCSQFKYHADDYWPAYLSNLGSHKISHSWVIDEHDIYLAGDFRGRGKDDLLMMNKDGDIQLVELNYHVQGWSWDIIYTDTFSANYLNKIYNAHLLVGDFDGNGKEELLVIDKSTGATDLHSYNGVNWTPLHNTSGPLFATWNIPANNSDTFLSGDFNGDAETEILILGNNGHSQLVKFDTFTGWSPLWSGNNSMIAWWVFNVTKDTYGIGDFNSDGRDDLIAMNPNGWTHTMYFDGDNWQYLTGNSGNNLLDWWPIQAHMHPDTLLVGKFCDITDLTRSSVFSEQVMIVHDDFDFSSMFSLNNSSNQTPIWQLEKYDTQDKLWTIDHSDKRIVGNFNNNLCDSILNVNKLGIWQLNTDD